MNKILHPALKLVNMMFATICRVEQIQMGPHSLMNYMAGQIEAMSYSIEPSEDGKYIILKHWGIIDRKLTTQRNLDAHALGTKLGIARHLVDLTEARHVDTIINTYNFAYEDMRTLPGINKSARVAVLVNPDDHSHDFVETVARNAGQNVTLFRDRETAIQHLLKD